MREKKGDRTGKMNWREEGKKERKRKKKQVDIRTLQHCEFVKLKL